MKSLYTFLFITLPFWGTGQAILDQEETSSRTVQDPNTVILTDNFKASAAKVQTFIAKIGPATQVSGGGPTDSHAGNNNPRGTLGNIPFQDTQGTIEVDVNGQLNYSLAIALPPGIKSVAPQINMVYTSGGGNGIAGYGWNLSGDGDDENPKQKTPGNKYGTLEE
ncbi:hypothetical protein GNY06_07180 [Elizabethkingia argentiflava]|uniref:Uncharacterized protein n=1 Tax=Elizabethkingia argenteiflava TaxID=2681556 RepID=A0A845PWC3_9FLAO|nr:SpvB/TcaC N-terminal domain-containing protein [Elizabethkingia argenteiflava]NAW51166.1 hypothetical protein [Elizabethkingia argenteiflava]